MMSVPCAVSVTTIDEAFLAMRVDLQPSYILHSRPYRDSSALLDVFTAEHGRISLVARGARRQTRKGSKTALLQPFTPLLLSFSGRSELKTLAAIEGAGAVIALRGERMFSAMYVNEVLVRLLHQNDAHPALFAAYSEVLQALVDSASPDTVLRKFELTLLYELGYSFDFDVDGSSGQPVCESRQYCYDPGCGMVAFQGGKESGSSSYTGADLLLMASGELDGRVRPVAKRLLREVLAAHLGDKPLRSRDLFRAGRRESEDAFAGRAVPGITPEGSG